jgi:hypothetical protein
MLTIVLVVVLLPVSSFAEEPLQPGYRVNDRLQLYFAETRVSGPGVAQPGLKGYLVCTYSTRPVTMVYTREITPAVVRLIKKLDETTAIHDKDRLGSYVVLICDSEERQKDLLALARKENIQNTLLALVVINEDRPNGRAMEKFGAAETTVILATAQRQVKASYAYRPGEMQDRDIERILGDRFKILPQKDDEGRPVPARP